MEKTHNLEEICNLLYTMKPNWNKIIDRFRSYPDSNRALTLQQYGKYFSEIHLDLCIEEIKEQHPEYNISLKSVKEEKRKRRKEERYKRRRDQVLEDITLAYDKAGRLEVHSKRDRTTHEYDKLIRVGNLPVVFEIKLTKWKQPIKQRRRGRGGKVKYVEGKGIQNSLRPEVYNERLRVIRRFFGCNVGYVMVIPYRMYLRRELLIGQPIPQEGTIYNNFKANNGIVVPFYKDRKDFREELLQKVKDYGFKLKEG